MRTRRSPDRGTWGFVFDGVASDASVHALAKQIAPIVHQCEKGITFEALFSEHCNSSPADSARYRLAIERLVEHKELVVVGEKGEKRRKASTIGEKDVIKVPSQTIFWPIA